MFFRPDISFHILSCWAVRDFAAKLETRVANELVFDFIENKYT